jgi:hypothetical protein
MPCNSTGCDRYEKIIWKFKRLEPPVIFFDNNPGYTCIESLPYGRKGDSLAWGNAKYCMGYTFFAHAESIGVGVVINGEIFTIASQRIEDFFGISSDDEGGASASIICAIQIDYDRIYVGAVTVYNGSTTYAGKIASARGLAVGARTKIKFSAESPKISGLYEKYFNEDGSSSENMTPVGPGDMIVTYEKYVESHGFSDVSSKTGITGLKSKSALKDIYKRVASDINSLSGSSLATSGVFSMISMVYEDKIIIVQLLTDSVYESIYSGSWSPPKKYKLDKPTCQGDFNNVYEGRLFIVPPTDMSENNNYDRIFAPPGVFFRYNTFSALVIVSSSDKSSRTYQINTEKGKGLDWDKSIDSETNAIKSTGGESSSFGCDTSGVSFAGNEMMMNFPDVYLENILAVYKKTKATKETLGDAATVVRSMSLYIPYMSRG